MAELAERWEISRAAASQFIASREGFPVGRRVRTGPVWALEDIEAWEVAEQAAGRALPGGRRRGPQPGEGGRPRKPRTDPDA